MKYQIWTFLQDHHANAYIREQFEGDTKSFPFRKERYNSFIDRYPQIVQQVTQNKLPLTWALHPNS